MTLVLISSFGRIVESGAHETSLHMLLDGRVDATAVDSVVLDLEPGELRRQVRVLETFGPSPGPPAVAHRSLPAARRRRIAQALARFPADHPAARRYGLRCFAPVDDAFYDGIRRMAAVAEAVPWA